MTRGGGPLVLRLYLAVASLLAACTGSTVDGASSFPGSAGATEWRDVTEIPGELGAANGTHASADALFDAFVYALTDPPGTPPDEASGTVVPLSEDEAAGTIEISGHPDDSIAGQEYRLTMRRGNAGWFVDSAEVRTHCRRGVFEGVCV